MYTKYRTLELKLETTKITNIHIALREHLRTHETFTPDQILRDVLGSYYQFSIKSYVVAIY